MTDIRAKLIGYDLDFSPKKPLFYMVKLFLGPEYGKQP